MKFTKEQVLELLRPIKVVKILEVTKHPNADRLFLASVDLGDGTTKQVVTGAANMKPGDLVLYLGEGNTIPGYLLMKGEKIVLEKKMMRGIESDSMILARDEIGLSNDHEWIFILTDEIKNEELRIKNSDELIGMSFIDVVGDEVIEKICETAGVIEITPELQARIDLIKSIARYGGEIVGEDELPAILSSGEELFTYDGFEPSGQMHIAQGIIRAINTNKMIKTGFKFKMWVADWFGYLNNKMGGDMEKIQTVGKYFIEIWKASGMDLDNTEFLWTSDFVGQKDYWETVMKVAKSTTLNRILRTTEIMGRSESDTLTAAQVIYPCMQATDIFKVMKCQVTQLGMDQRKVNMLAREVGPELGFWKPIVVSHGMLQGLGKPTAKDADPVERAISMKMSKSKPETAIFMTDSEEEVRQKIIDAYCPPGVVEDNPILDYCRQIIFEAHHLKGQENLLKDGFVINREEKFGGNVTYKTYEELEADYVSQVLFPLDLKNAVIFYINRLIEPVRKHFATDTNAKMLLGKVASYRVTR